MRTTGFNLTIDRRFLFCIIVFMAMITLSFCEDDKGITTSGTNEENSSDTTSSSGEYELVWSDEFNYEGPPDPNKWTYDIGHGEGGWGNNEVQYYTDEQENVRVEDGNLIIDAIKENGEWTSARIKTQGLQSFKHVTVKVRAKLPEGSGTWPAIWMLGSNITEVGWPASGEIDIMEHVGKDPGMVHSSLHTPSSFGSTENTSQKEVPDFHDEFHVYEAEWTADSIIFKIDGEEFYTYSPYEKNAETWPFNDDFFIIMNIAMGGNWGSDPDYETGGMKNGIDPDLSEARMVVDYVRVYKN